MTLHYPSSWKTEQAQQDGVSYRYFLAPPAGPDRKPAVSVTLVAQPLGVALDQYAQTYLAGNTVQSTRGETRPGARGKYHLFASPDGKTRFALLLLEESAESRTGLPATPAPRPSASAPPPVTGKASVTVRPSPTPIATPVPAAAAAEAPGAYVYGLFAQGDTAAFDAQLPVIEEMVQSLTLERPDRYPEEKNDKFAFSLRAPASWTSTRSFASGTTFLRQYTSPAFGADKAQTVHASLTLTAEPAADVDSYYKATVDKAGDTVGVLSHSPWRGGYVDVIQSETPVAVTRARRYYRVADGRGYTLACDARSDIYTRVWRWCDMIAATLKIGPEVKAP